MMLTMIQDNAPPPDRAPEGVWIKLPWELRRQAKKYQNGVTVTRNELTPEIMKWLDENVGERDRHYCIYQSQETNPRHMAVYFPDEVRQRDVILMFKLMWGGNV